MRHRQSLTHIWPCFIVVFHEKCSLSHAILKHKVLKNMIGPSSSCNYNQKNQSHSSVFCLRSVARLSACDVFIYSIMEKLWKERERGRKVMFSFLLLMQVEWYGRVTDGDRIIVFFLNWFFIRLKQVQALLICYSRQNVNEAMDKLTGMLPRPYGAHALLPKRALNFNTRAKSPTVLHKLAPFTPY